MDAFKKKCIKKEVKDTKCTISEAQLAQRAQRTLMGGLKHPYGYAGARLLECV